MGNEEHPEGVHQAVCRVVIISNYYVRNGRIGLAYWCARQVYLGYVLQQLKIVEQHPISLLSKWIPTQI